MTLPFLIISFVCSSGGSRGGGGLAGASAPVSLSPDPPVAHPNEETATVIK